MIDRQGQLIRSLIKKHRFGFISALIRKEDSVYFPKTRCPSSGFFLSVVRRTPECVRYFLPFLGRLAVNPLD